MQIFYHGQGRLSIVLYMGNYLFREHYAPGRVWVNFTLAIRLAYVTI